MGAGTGSTLRRRQLGMRLRELREAARLTIGEVGEHIDHTYFGTAAFE